MKNTTCFLSLIVLMLLYSCNSPKQPTTTAANEPTPDMSPQSIYDFTVTDLDGVPFNFNTLKGKKVMIVNTASECGNTPQYQDLQMTYDKYKGRNLVIVGFPANNFGGQEPGSDLEIAAFCQLNYGVTFPIMSKIRLKEMICIPCISSSLKRRKMA